MSRPRASLGSVQDESLRVLEDQKVERLGSNEWFAVNVRVIAASKGNLKQLAEQEGVSGKIQLLGAVPHHELAARLAQSDLYIQPSIIDPKTFQEESFGVVLLEALAVGLPLIVTRTGGMPEIVGEENTFARIIPDQDADAIFRALKDLFQIGTCFQDTSAYSQKRLAAFTPARQMEDLRSAYSRVMQSCQLSANGEI